MLLPRKMRKTASILFNGGDENEDGVVLHHSKGLCIVL